MEFLCDYMRIDAARHALNRLTADTFGFDFENWYSEGSDRGGYAPYSYMEGGEIVANASANCMNYLWNGQMCKLVQIGTVAVRRDYRGRGLARKLIARLRQAYAGTCEGFYLFSNDTATGFYEKLGFRRENQYVYAPKRPVCREAGDFVPVPMCDAGARRAYLQALARACANSGFDARNYSLTAFYTMEMENAYYSKQMDAYAFMCVRGGTLYLDEITSPRPVSALHVLARAGLDYARAVIRFTPRVEEAHAFTPLRAENPDDNYFALGPWSGRAEREALCFSPFSRA